MTFLIPPSGTSIAQARSMLDYPVCKDALEIMQRSHLCPPGARRKTGLIPFGESQMKYETSRNLNFEKPKDAGAPASSRLILVVDDELDNLVMLSLELQQSGYRVLTAANGDEAFKIASVARPDLILMDIAMPVMDGLGATRNIRAEESLSRIPIIALTAFATEGFRQSAYEVEIDGYLTKPIDFDRLHYLMSGLLARAEELKA